MDWKALLKPSKEKFLAAILIFALFVPFVTYDNGIRCFMAPCPASDTGSVFSWLFPRSWSNYTFMLFGQRQSLPMPAHVYSLDIPLALFGFAVCYAAACFSIPFYGRFLKKRN